MEKVKSQRTEEKIFANHISDKKLESMGFSRQECWSRLLFPSPGDLPNPGIEPMSPALSGGFFTTVSPIYTFSDSFPLY